MSPHFWCSNVSGGVPPYKTQLFVVNLGNPDVVVILGTIQAPATWTVDNSGTPTDSSTATFSVDPNVADDFQVSTWDQFLLGQPLNFIFKCTSGCTTPEKVLNIGCS
jgi:hypothetical protein